MPKSIHRSRLWPFCTLLFAHAALAEEGMWPVNAFPSEAVKQTYGFAPDAAWLEQVRLASVRLAGGCSASFVSGDGLVLTNHHCVRGCLEDLSTPKNDLLARGFQAASQNGERRCPKVEANQLLEITDVSARIQQATHNLSGAAFGQAQKAAQSLIESECATSAQLRCDVVSLYQGSVHHLYKYRRLQDVRMVFAPELSMAMFGGDPDNFSFPRYAADFAFLRVWEGNAPAKTPHHFGFARQRVSEGELTFVSGHPGGTERLEPLAALEFVRDVQLPHSLMRLAELRGVLNEFRKGSPERERVTTPRLRSVENSLKALRGRQAFVASATFLPQRAQQEAALRAQLAKSPELEKIYGGAWTVVRQTLDAFRPLYVRYSLIEGGEGFGSELFSHARSLVRAAEERPKPNGLRLRELTDARLPALEQRLFGQTPIPAELEELTLAFGLGKLRELLGPDDPFVKDTLGRESPESLARKLVRGSRLSDAKVRRALYEGGSAAILASKDPMIVFALKVDPGARSLRKKYEEELEPALKKNQELIAQAHIAVRGRQGYPDATFTLRLSYGQVKGWEEGGKTVPAFTTLNGLFERNTGEPPFDMSARWLQARTALALDTPMNLSSSHDIIGGNSGSPMINTRRELVGLIFDGNLPSLGGRYGYDAASHRAVSVSSALILEALEKIYRAQPLLHELQGVPSVPPPRG